MPAINYCIYKLNIWCIPTTEIATWWQVVIAAVAVGFAIKAIRATNATSQAVLDRDQKILEAKRAAFLSPLTNEVYEVLVRTYQIKNLLAGDQSQDAYEHTFHTLLILETPCIERCIGVIEAFRAKEASELTKCSLAISKCHNFVRGNPLEKLADAADRKTMAPSLQSIVKDLETTFSSSLEVISVASGIAATSANAANWAASRPLFVPRNEPDKNGHATTPPLKNAPVVP